VERSISAADDAASLVPMDRIGDAYQRCVGRWGFLSGAGRVLAMPANSFCISPSCCDPASSACKRPLHTQPTHPHIALQAGQPQPSGRRYQGGGTAHRLHRHPGAVMRMAAARMLAAAAVTCNLRAAAPAAAGLARPCMQTTAQMSTSISLVRPGCADRARAAAVPRGPPGGVCLYSGGAPVYLHPATQVGYLARAGRQGLGA